MKHLSNNDFNNNQLDNIPNGVDPQDAVNKRQLDATLSPADNLDKIEILARFPIEHNGSFNMWTQGFNINEITNEVYLSYQGGAGDRTTLVIETRDMDGTLKSRRDIPTANNAYTEALPYFYNGSSQLCFIVRKDATTSQTYSIYNYDTNSLGSSIPINGMYKAAVDGKYFITTNIHATAGSQFYIYDWESVKSGSPILIKTVQINNAGTTVGKTQGIAAGGGYIFLTMGGAGESTIIGVYTTEGVFVKNVALDSQSVVDLINSKYPDATSLTGSYKYENESAIVYKGRLLTLQTAGKTYSTSYSYLLWHGSGTLIAQDYSHGQMIGGAKGKALIFWEPDNTSPGFVSIGALGFRPTKASFTPFFKSSTTRLVGGRGVASQDTTGYVHRNATAFASSGSKSANRQFGGDYCALVIDENRNTLYAAKFVEFLDNGIRLEVMQPAVPDLAFMVEVEQ